jgi:hypothetical protein
MTAAATAQSQDAAEHRRSAARWEFQAAAYGVRGERQNERDAQAVAAWHRSKAEAA